jgi:sugar (pentulose or hexulose) kinase
MSPGILIGVDVGSTVLKAAAFDAASGQVLAGTGRRLSLRVGRDGAREQSPAALDRALTDAMAFLREKLGRRWQSVRGIGLASQGGSTIIADRRTGRALTPMILWNDTRSAKHAAEVVDGTTPGLWRRKTLRDFPGVGLSKILWLKEMRPEIVAEHNIYIGAGEYSYFHLTGVWRQDACNALMIGCYNAVRGCLDQRLMNSCGMPVSFVAPLRNGHETHSISQSAVRRLGLPENVAVAGPYMDHEAGYLSAIGVLKKPLQCSLGTAWVGNFVLPRNEKWVSPFQLALPSPAGKGWLVVQPLLTGNVTWDWALEQFVDRDHGKALRAAERIFAKSLLPREGLAALPWLNVANPFAPQAIGGAGFYGISPQTDTHELLRAVAVAMAYEMARVFREVVEKKKVDGVVLGGGASKGEFFRVLLASLFAPLPVYVTDDQDVSGCRGAVHAYSRKAARSTVRRVKPPAAGLRTQIEKDYQYYLEIYDRILGDIPHGRGIHFGA